jgi:hypothetical protein
VSLAQALPWLFATTDALSQRPELIEPQASPSPNLTLTLTLISEP